MPLFAIILVLISTFIHAGWNLLIRSQQSSYVFLRMALIISAIGLGPALLGEWLQTPFPAQVWLYLVFAGLFQSLYYLGLTQGYQKGDFSVVYPIARASPILLIAMADVIRGHAPSPLAWLAMIAVSLGCVITPLKSWQEFRLSHYWNSTMIWIMVTALAIVGYSLVDKAAAELIDPGPSTAARYCVYETAFSALWYWLILIVRREPPSADKTKSWSGWQWSVVGAMGVFGAYWLILWSYQLASQASYVVALRQLSIVIGVMLGSTLFREPARGLRIAASVVIALGAAGIALAS